MKKQMIRNAVTLALALAMSVGGIDYSMAKEQNVENQTTEVQTTEVQTTEVQTTEVQTTENQTTKEQTTVSKISPKLNVNVSKLNVAAGRKVALTVSTDSDGKITFKSDNSKIATIDDNGIIRGKKTGTTNIRVSVPATEKYSAVSKEIRINVTLPYVISVSKKKMNMKTRTEKKLKVKVKDPYGYGLKPKVIFKTSNKKVATVSKKGKVTAVSQGKCTLTILAEGGQKKKVKLTVKNPSMKKVIYLTYDDGPGSTVTPRLLDVLKKYNAKATFFLVGTQINGNSKIVKREKREGHTLAVHTYTHMYSQIYASADAYVYDFNRTAKLIKKIAGVKPRYWRFPGGGNNRYITAGIQKQILKRLHSKGYMEMDWSAATNDATGVSYTTAQMTSFGISSIESAFRNGKIPVVLIHDTNAKVSTPAVTEAILKYFTAKGYKFKGLDDYYGNEITFKK